MEKATKITLTTVTKKSGLFGSRLYPEEVLTLFYPKGKVVVTQTVLEATGDSWKLFKRRLEASACNSGIPFEKV